MTTTTVYVPIGTITDILGAVLLSIGMFGLGFMTCLYLVFGSTVWIERGREP